MKKLISFLAVLILIVGTVFAKQYKVQEIKKGTIAIQYEVDGGSMNMNLEEGDIIDDEDVVVLSDDAVIFIVEVDGKGMSIVKGPKTKLAKELFKKS